MAAPTVLTPTISGPALCPGIYYTLRAVYTSSLPVTYQWYDGATIILGATSRKCVVGPFAPSTGHNYKVKVSNADGSTDSPMLNFFIPAGPPPDGGITVNIGDIMKLQFYCQYSDQTAVNVTHWECTGKTGVGTTIADWNAAALATLQPGYSGWQPSSVFVMGVVSQLVFPALSEAVPYAMTPPAAGSAGTQPLPSQLCGLLQWRGAANVRHGKGRIYVPFPDATNLHATSDLLSAAGLAALEALRLLYSAPLVVGGGANTNTYSLVIWDRVGLVATQIPTTLKSSKFATQKRRGQFGKQERSPFG